MRDEQGHDWQVSQTEHPFLTGWVCSRCKRTTTTRDGLIPADEPSSTGPCVAGAADEEPVRRLRHERRAGAEAMQLLRELRRLIPQWSEGDLATEMCSRIDAVLGAKEK